jgi:hypothetical protein
MDHEYDKQRKHSQAAATTHNDPVEPGRSSRSAVLRKPEHPVASGLVQRRADAAGALEPSAVHAAAAQGVATASSQLPYLDTIQRAFGHHDISSVHAHTGPDAAASANAMGARAFATGNHVVLGAGADLHTVAHEAAHVVQQRGGVQLKGGVGEVGDPYERHADAVADLVVAGKSAQALLDQKSAPGGQSSPPSGAVQHVLHVGGRNLQQLSGSTKTLLRRTTRNASAAVIGVLEGWAANAAPGQRSFLNWQDAVDAAATEANLPAVADQAAGVDQAPDAEPAPAVEPAPGPSTTGGRLPPYLYHSAPYEAAHDIATSGLEPRSGPRDDQYLCMSGSQTGATSANRKASDVIFRVNTRQTAENGWVLEGAGEREWRSRQVVPPQFLTWRRFLPRKNKPNDIVFGQNPELLGITDPS